MVTARDNWQESLAGGVHRRGDRLIRAGRAGGSDSWRHTDSMPSEDDASSAYPRDEESRDRLRRVLGFPEVVDDPAPARRIPTRPPAESSAPDAADSQQGELAARVGELGDRVDRLTAHMQALVDRATRSDDLVSSRSSQDTIDERLGELAAQMSSLSSTVERLTEHSRSTEAALARDEDFASRIDGHLAMIAKGVLEVQRRAEERSDAAPDVADPALEQVGRWFAETNTRLVDDATEIRSDLRRFQDHIAGLTSALERAAETAAVESDPTAKLDAAVVQAMESRFEEIARQLIEKMDDSLVARMQRFEALSQAMITLVGDPVDTLTSKLQQLAAQREAMTDAVETLRTMAETQQRILRALGSSPLDGDA